MRFRNFIYETINENMKVLIIIPAYNEAQNIEKVIFLLNEKSPDVHYVIVNDCSKDNTAEICKKNGFNYISLPVNLGIGGGVQAGYIYAAENDFDIAIQMDGDGQHDATYINELIQPIIDGEADIVIGSRFIKMEGFQSSRIRRFGIDFLSLLIRMSCGIHIKDVTSGFRAVNKRFINIYANDYSQDYPEPEAIIAGAMYKGRIKEVPVIMHERKAGASSINAWKSIYYMIKVSISIIIYRLTFIRKRTFDDISYS